jgi:GAF domain-containing protein
MNIEITGDERRRCAALYETGLLFSDPSENFDRITRLARQLFKTKVSLISFAAEDVVWHKSMNGCDLPSLPRKNSFCGHAIQSDSPLIVHDAARDAVFAANPRVAGGPRIRFFAGVPISLAPGVRIGTVSILDDQPRHFTAEDAEALHILSRIAVTEIRLLSTARALRDALSR